MSTIIQPDGEGKFPNGLKLDGDQNSQSQESSSPQETGASREESPEIGDAQQTASIQTSSSWEQDWEWAPPTSTEEKKLIWKLLSSSALTELIRNPGHAKQNASYWRAIPRKRERQLRCEGKDLVDGWGLIATMQYSLVTLIFVWILPALLIALGISIGLTVCFHWNGGIATGIISGIVGVEALVFHIIINYYKQRGLME
jgi:hypothetical protein